MRLMGRVKYGKPLAIPYNYQKQLVLFIAFYLSPQSAKS